MFVSKINNGIKNPAFKGYQREVDDCGNNTLRFNIPFDRNNEVAEIKFFKVKKVTNTNVSGTGLNAKQELPVNIAYGTPIKTVTIDNSDGVVVGIDTLRKEGGLAKDEALAYQVVIRDKNNQDKRREFKDTGLGVAFYGDDQYKYQATYLPTNIGVVQGLGSGVLVMPKVHRPGVYRDEKTGKIVEDKNLQKAWEKMNTHFSSNPGGGLVGIIHDLDEISKSADVVVLNPFAGADNKSHHGYWNKNNKQISDDMGNINDFNELATGLFRRGMTMVNDGTFTSEGLEGIHFQYALRWKNYNPQSYYWFRMGGLKNAPISLGVMPKDPEHIRHRVINPTHVYDPKTNSVVKNKAYNPSKETFVQLYDDRLVTEEQLSELDKPIDRYRKIRAGEYNEINTHNDTAINYLFPIRPEEYKTRLEEFVRYNNSVEEKIDINSPDAVLFICQFSNFKLGVKADGGMVTWDANSDMVKMSYFLSPYDENSELEKILDPQEREAERARMKIGTYEVRDMAVQAGSYWTQKYADVLNLYLATVIGNNTTAEELDDMIDSKLIPASARLSQDALDNIEDGFYELAPKQKLSRNDMTIKSLMKLPFDTLELADKTVGVLATSYFTNLATSPEYIGMSRFDLYKAGNPHLLKEYKPVYDKVNKIFDTQIKNFADKVIEKINEQSSEKLLDEKGAYTVYGEYVVELIGQEIAKYALLKSIMRDNLEMSVTEDIGDIKYNYKKQRAESSLDELGIRGITPEDEANQLANYISEGLKLLSDSDVEKVSTALSNQIAGTNTMSFKIAEAMLKKTPLIMPWRLDAAKDLADMDSVRNRKLTFDEAWDEVVTFWKEFSDSIKKINPNVVIIAEITDLEQLVSTMHANCVYENKKADSNTIDAMHSLGIKYVSQQDAVNALIDAGVTTEAAYSHTFTDAHGVYSFNPETGDKNENKTLKSFFDEKMNHLVNYKTQDYFRTLYTFMDNHDKPSVLFNYAVNLELFFADLSANPKTESVFKSWRRAEAMAQMTNCDSVENLSLETLLNLKNSDYFRTISPKAVAVAELMRKCINELNTSDEKKATLKAALVDLLNDNFMGKGKTVDYQTIKIKELTSAKDAVDKVASLGGVNLGGRAQDIANCIMLTKDNSPLQNNFVINDMNDPVNRGRVDNILGSEHAPYETYSPYTVALAGLLLTAYERVCGQDGDNYTKFKSGLAEFVKTYTNEYVESNRSKLPLWEPYRKTMCKDAFAAGDFRTTIEMLIKQAEYRDRQNNVLGENASFDDANQNLYKEMFKSCVEPSIAKTLMYATVLAAFPGIPTTFIRDMYLGLGFDYKSKNEFVRNRGVTNISDKEGGPLQDITNQVYNSFEKIMSIRKRTEFAPLNNGTPYMITGADGGDVWTSGGTVVSYLVQGADGKMVIPLITADGVQKYYRYGYKNSGSDKYIPKLSDVKVDKIVLPKDLKLADGTEFYYEDGGEEIICKAYNVNGKTEIKRDNNDPILMTAATMLNGVLFLKQKAATIVANNHPNKKYNISTNIYAKRLINSLKGKI